MTQLLRTFVAGKRVYLDFPDAREEILPGVRWGQLDHLFTPAFWATQAVFFNAPETISGFQLGNSLAEEVTACILGGYGIPAEIGLAAYRRLRDEGLIHPTVSEDTLLSALSRPLEIGERRAYYRFARQKSHYIAEALRELDSAKGLSSLSDQAFRTWLTKLPGVGLKTASWITRNVRGSSNVAIIDIHIYRAGCIGGWISSKNHIARDYFEIEKQFLVFSRALAIKPTILDCVIWDFMRRVGNVGLEAYSNAA